MFYLQLAFRNILRSKGRSFITLAAIGFGCVALIFTGGFIQDSLLQLRESYIRAHLGHLQIFKKGFTEHGVARPFDFLISNVEEVKKVLASLPHIEIIAPRLEFSGLLSTGETTISFIGQGVDPGLEKKMNDFLRIDAGENLAENDEYQVILGQGLANSISIKPKDPVILLSNSQSGSMNALDMSAKGIFHTSSKPFDDRALRVPLPAAQRLLQTDMIQTFVVLLDKTENTTRIKNQIETIFREKNLDLEVKPWYEMADFYTKAATFYDSQFGILKFIIIIVSILSVFNTMNMSVLERIGEIGTMRAIGTSQKKVVTIFLTEGVILGVLGGILGLTAGLAVAKIVSFVGIPMPPPPGSNTPWTAHIQLVPWNFVQSFLIAAISSFASAIFPAIKASRLVISEALRHNV